jgi:ABC-type microcin C transport system permease subunit YejE
MSQSSSSGNPVTSVVEGAVGLTGLSDWGRIASRIASWSIIFLSVVYFAAGLLLAARYSKHARLKRTEKEQRTAKAPASNNIQATTTVARAAGARVLIVWVTVLIPVVWTLIGAVLGFVLGMSIGSLIAGACILAKIELTSDLEIVIGIFIGFAKVVLAFVPSKVSIMFL